MSNHRLNRRTNERNAQIARSASNSLFERLACCLARNNSSLLGCAPQSPTSTQPCMPACLPTGAPASTGSWPSPPGVPFFRSSIAFTWPSARSTCVWHNFSQYSIVRHHGHHHHGTATTMATTTATHHVDVISHASAVVGIVVVAEDGQVFTAPDTNCRRKKQEGTGGGGFHETCTTILVPCAMYGMMYLALCTA